MVLAELDALGLERVPSIAHGLRLLDDLTDSKLRATFFMWLHGEDRILPDRPAWIEQYPALYYAGEGLPGLDAP